MRLAAILIALLLLPSWLSAYYIKQSREQLLDYYFSNIEDKVPQSARMLIGDEKINVYIGSQSMGIETRKGKLYSFEMYPIEKPTIVVKVTDDAAEKITKKQMGIMKAIETGGIKIEPNNLLSSIKVEMIKMIYAISGCDDKILGKGSAALQPYVYSSLYVVKKTRIEG